MEKNFVLNGNKLIRKFELKINNNKFFIDEYDLKYHKSWDWLMPVFQKCRKDLDISINNHRESILKIIRTIDYNKHPLLQIKSDLLWKIHYGDFEIETVYKWCLSYIKLYNKQK